MSPACFYICISIRDRDTAAALGEAAMREQMDVMVNEDTLIESDDPTVLIKGTVRSLGCTAVWKMITVREADAIIKDNHCGLSKNACLITDDSSLVEKAHNRHICAILVTCSGKYIRTEDSEHVADAELSSADSISLAFIRMTASHACGQPFVLHRTDEFIIRESIEEDRPKLQRISDDSSEGHTIMEMTSSASRFNDITTKAYAFYGFGMWTVVGSDTGEVIGWFGFYPENGLIWISYYLDRQYRGRGLALRITQVLLEYAWYEMGLTEVFAAIDDENKASISLAYKMGFVICEDKKRPLLILRKSLADDYQ